MISTTLSNLLNTLNHFNMIFTYTIMNMKKFFNIRNILIALLFIALIFTSVRNCTINKNLRNTVDSLSLANQTLQTINNEKDQLIYTQTAINTSNQEEIK